MPNKTVNGYAYIIYRDDILQIGWNNIFNSISLLGVPFAISPLHTPIDEKPHFHLLIPVRLDKKIVREIKKICNPFSSNDYVENVFDCKAYYYYLAHRDKNGIPLNGKQILSLKGIFTSNDFCVSDLACELSTEDRIRMFRECIEFVQDNCISEICDFYDLLYCTCQDMDFIDFAITQELKIKHYIDSFSYKNGLRK